MRDGPFDEKPGESEIEQHDTAVIPEVDITEEDLVETSEREDNWLVWGGGYESQRHYPSDAISPDNIDDLEIEYQFEFLTEDHDFQGSPIIVHGDPPIMYITFGPDHLYTMNARNGDVLWSHIYRPAVGTADESPSAERGVAVLGDTVYKSTLDLGVLAIDRYTGEERWYYNGACAYRDEPADGLMHEDLQWERSRGSTSSWPPLIYNGKLMKGSFGGEFGVSGFFDAINLDGEPEWRVNMTPADQWVGESWKHGGGTAWAAGAIDPENEIVIVPSANPGPWYGTPRPGWNQYSGGKVAVDIETGEYRWHYQDAPHEWWDYDSPSAPLVYTAEVDGEERRLVSWAPKTGWVHTVDAETGELVQRSEEYIDHLNMWSLPPKDDLESSPWIIPGTSGGTNREPSSYDPESRTIIVKGTSQPHHFSWTETEYQPGGRYLGMTTEGIRSPEDLEAYDQDEIPDEWGGNFGNTTAIDPVTGEVKWQDWISDARSYSGSLTTAGGVTLTGHSNGEVVVYDTETGDRLVTDDVGVGVDSGPIAWHDPHEEKHYMMINAGGRRAEPGNVISVYSLDA
nr:PQQ-binding-like beta-propeller repeat protein [Natrinema sp. SYSU A 869]